jgi:hypothetical protein
LKRFPCAHVASILQRLAAELSGAGHWTGACGASVCAADAEYLDEPALPVMLCDVPRDQFRVCAGVAPLPSAIRFRPARAHPLAGAGRRAIDWLLRRRRNLAAVFVR